jgi:hypothetical protein
MQQCDMLVLAVLQTGPRDQEILMFATLQTLLPLASAGAEPLPPTRMQSTAAQLQQQTRLQSRTQRQKLIAYCRPLCEKQQTLLRSS